MSDELKKRAGSLRFFELYGFRFELIDYLTGKWNGRTYTIKQRREYEVEWCEPEGVKVLEKKGYQLKRGSENEK